MSSLTTVEFTAVIAFGSLLAGFLGALTGLGGGVVIVPMLTLLFGVDIKYAIGAALVSVIATSSGAAAAYVRDGYSNIRVGMFLEIATTIGALSGAALALYLRASVIAIIFGMVLLYSAYASFRQKEHAIQDEGPDRIATWLHMDSSFPTANGLETYHVRRVPLGFVIMYVRAAGNRLRRGKSLGHGSSHEAAVQSLDHHQQFHDWSHGGGQRGNLSESRLY